MLFLENYYRTILVWDTEEVGTSLEVQLAVAVVLDEGDDRDVACHHMAFDDDHCALEGVQQEDTQHHDGIDDDGVEDVPLLHRVVEVERYHRLLDEDGNYHDDDHNASNAYYGQQVQQQEDRNHDEMENVAVVVDSFGNDDWVVLCIHHGNARHDFPLAVVVLLRALELASYQSSSLVLSRAAAAAVVGFRTVGYSPLMNHSISKFDWKFHQLYSVGLVVMVALFVIQLHQEEDQDDKFVARDSYCNNLDVVMDDSVVVAAAETLHPFL